MSDKKKQVIHVKDLVIKADNVTLDQPEQRPDPFFGPRRPNPLFGPVKRNRREEETLDDASMESSAEKPEENAETKPNPLFGPKREVTNEEMYERRRRRNFDPILGRPLNIRDESSSESLESSISSEESSNEEKDKEK